ncbi:phenylacetate-CoA oxygenase subunit PaaJ [Azospirillum melinis]|uniref:Phenylacetate-CoA oxygenase subunit PaaJ n=1 Tax=Azospirillum melinis TaxID=328839 RepID=A0ABX2KIN3_9PROT|nr:1,2-phenylacetyl-CoA epoxidase subunit PaaD [Azospirillum melinis]MBP2305663.1 ring-1,2-phenylacetyl-CoA epoxidase subunit PaaD [Azospirillum melinis]NUB02427.1 phenylacetate-CoA oxygenase subunit PaaJ [Azospirillum melinis]
MPDAAGCWGPEPGADAVVKAAWDALAGVMDPEIPVLSIVDLGIVRAVSADADGRLSVALTPTYSGCPATNVIVLEAETALARARLDARVSVVIAPPWTTDWISDAGREKLAEVGIVPPPQSGKRALTAPDEVIACPRCGSTDTRQISRFGSTACKALHACNACLEPFDVFKCH